MQQQIAAWFNNLPIPARLAVLAVIALLLFVFYAGPMLGIEMSVDMLVRWLPVVAVLAVAGGAGGFYLWRKREQKQLEQQMALNRQLASQGMVRLALPPQESKDNWKKISDQAETFAAFVATALRQFPIAHVCLEIVGTEQGIVFQVWSPEDVFQTILQGLLAAFPEAQMREPDAVLKVPDALDKLAPDTQWTLLGLSQKPHYPLRSTSEFPSESLSSILAALTRTPGMGRTGVQLVLKAPSSDKWAATGQREVEQQRAAMAQTKGASRPADRQRIDQLGAKADSLTGIATTVIAFAEPASANRLGRLVMSLCGFTRSRYNALRVVAQEQGAERVTGRHFDHKAGRATILSAEELAPLWHVPRGEGDVLTGTGVVIPPPAQVVEVTRPAVNPSHRILGRGTMRTGERVPVKWPYGAPDYFDSLVHMAVIGATGSGKSTLVANLIGQDVCSGRCADVLIEPHRNLTFMVIGMTPREREQDVVWVNPTSPDRTFGLNPLDCGGDPRYRAAVGAAFTKALQRIVGGDFETMPRMVRILSSTVEAVMDGIEQPTISHLVNFLRYEDYRNGVVEAVKNSEVKAFWTEEFPKMAGAKQADALQPVFNRLSPMMVREMTRHVLVQPHTTLPMRQLIDAGKTILIDVSASNPEIGDDNAKALGTLLVNAVWGAARSRVKGTFVMPCFLWIDEFHLFVTRDIEKMFAEARGFGVGVYVATQYYDQLPDWMQAAILNNVWTKLVGRTNGPDEARLASRIFVGVDAQQILTLPSYTYIAQVTAGKQPTPAFTLETLPLMPADKLRAAYAYANGGQMPTLAQAGAAAYDPFAGVARMSASDAAIWRRHQQAMGGMDLMERATYLAGLEAEALEEYKRVRRQADLVGYLYLLENTGFVPDVTLAEDEEKSLKPEVLRKVKRVRRLSSLAYESPRDEIEAERLTLEQAVNKTKTDYDAMLTNL